MKYYILSFFICICSRNAQANKDDNQDPALEGLAPRIHGLLDKIDSACDLVYSLYEPFPKALELSKQYPLTTIAISGSWAYLYKKEKKASYIYAGALYYALYHRIKQNRRYGLAARGFLRNREALVIPDDPDANE